MDIPVQVAVRLKPPNLKDSNQCVFTNPVSHNIVTESGQTFQVSKALPVDYSQAQVYTTIASPQLNCILEGCDTSVIVFGQSSTGKTYTLFGPGFECIHSESEQGVVPRFLIELFHKLGSLPERTCSIHLSWVQLVGGSNVVDLLGTGLVRCNNLEEAYVALRAGWGMQVPHAHHTVFTVSLEQRWISNTGLLVHSLSTATFCELAGYPEPSFYAVERIIKSLAEQNAVDYDCSILTAMLRDSLGGRAFTWVIFCLSTDCDDLHETIKYLELSLCCQNVKNYVTVNSFADNNMPVSDTEKCIEKEETTTDRFAHDQWMKLITKAECIFNDLLQCRIINDTVVSKISEWLCSKAECDECLNEGPSKYSSTKQALPRISEDTEPSEPSESDVESDGGSTQSDTLFQDKLHKFMQLFKDTTDRLFDERCEEFIQNATSDDFDISETSESHSVPFNNLHTQSGRRRSVQPGTSISGDELKYLTRAAEKAASSDTKNKTCNKNESELNLVKRDSLQLSDSMGVEPCKKYKMILQKYNQKLILTRKLTKEINNSESHLMELVNLCIEREKFINRLAKSKQKSNKNNEEKECNRLSTFDKALSNEDQFAKHLKEYDFSDSNITKELRKSESKLKSYKKKIEQIKRQIKKDEKRKNTLEVELVKDKLKLEEFYDKDLSDTKEGESARQKWGRQVPGRLTQLERVLGEKTGDLCRLQLCREKELMLRREVRNLRRARDGLLTQRTQLGHKRKLCKSLSDSEERELLECEEAIEAIDTAIECKNAAICGRSPPPALPARLQRLSHHELQTLLCKYFQKVVDLRGACAGLEAAVGAAAAEAGAWRARAQHRNADNEMALRCVEPSYLQSPIPVQSLRRLLGARGEPAARVTRTHNKLVIVRPPPR